MRRKSRRKIKIRNLQFQDTKLTYRFIIVTILIIFIILFFLSSLLNLAWEEPAESREKEKIEAFFSFEDSTKVSMYLPAVDAEGNGVNTVLIVEASPGSGRTLTDIDNLLFWADTQHSIRTARRVAENITGRKEQQYDIVYSIEANASLIGGPSAGAALAIATIAVLEGKKPREEVMITGSINHDGSIGPVSGIFEKAKAAKDIGAELFVVPLLQSRDIAYETTGHCEVFGNTQICTTETKLRKIDVQEEVNIEVQEAASVQEAMEYFFE